MSVGPSMSLRQAAQSPWDVVIVGAGPAGALAAREIASRTTHQVLLLDRASFPRAKVCGGCLTPRAVHLLQCARLGSVVAQESRQSLHRLEVRYGRKRTGVKLPGGAVVSRETFDEALVQAAIKAQATFIPRTLVDIERIDGGDRDESVELKCRDLANEHEPCTITTRLVIDASGLNGRPDHRRRGSYVGTGALVEYNGNVRPVAGEIIMTCSAHGYVGVTRLDARKVIVAAAWDPAFVHRCGGRTSAACRILDDNGSHDLCAIVQNAPWHSTPYLTQRPHAVARYRLLSLGDSAGYVEPFTGDGITLAIQSALAVVPVVELALQHRAWSADVERCWARTLRRAVGPAQRTSRIMTLIARRPVLTRAALTFMNLFPGVVTPLIGRMNGSSQNHRQSSEPRRQAT